MAEILENIIDINLLRKFYTLTSAQITAAINAAVADLVQSVTATGETGTDGTVTVDGNEVAVKGYNALASDVSNLKNNAVSVSLATEAQIEAMFNTAE